MTVRTSMNNLIARVRILTNDTLAAGAGQLFTDQTIQDVMDATRQDLRYLALTPSPTYSTSSIIFVEYFSDWTDWEDDVTFWQYRSLQVTPSVSENITGHWTFATSTLPPVYLLGKTYDVYRTAADLLERLAAQWTLSYDFMSDNQLFKRSQVVPSLLTLAKQYRMKQRPTVIATTRSDISAPTQGASLAPTPFDYMDVSGG